MILYNDEIWDNFISFLKAMTEYKKFDEPENDRYKKRTIGIYERTLSGHKIAGTDLKLFKETIDYLGSKELDMKTSEILNEASLMGLKAYTTFDGANNFKEAEIHLEKRKKEEIKNGTIARLEREAKDAKFAHDRFMEEQKKTEIEWQEAQRRLEEAEKEIDTEFNKIDDAVVTNATEGKINE